MTGRHPIVLVVNAEEDGVRLDQFVVRRMGISRGSVRRLLEQKLVLVEGRPEAKGRRLTQGQQVVVAAVARSERPVAQPEMALDVLVERDDLVVINKQAGIPCHPLVPGETDTVANAIAARFPECLEASPQAREGGLVHRLDWSTSGVLVAARTSEAYGRLRGAFSGGRTLKHYLALVEGEVAEAGRVRSEIRTVPGDRTRMEVVFPADAPRGSREAETFFEPLEQLGQRTLVHITCCTGHRHQVRLHLAHAGHPLVGDDHYGGLPLDGVEGAFLHAARLTLLDEDARFEAPLPPQRAILLRDLGSSRLTAPEEPITLPRGADKTALKKQTGAGGAGARADGGEGGEQRAEEPPSTPRQKT
jgi:23S rRNA pseudouridine1911/1915/1917 synthase